MACRGERVQKVGGIAKDDKWKNVMAPTSKKAELKRDGGPGLSGIGDFPLVTTDLVRVNQVGQCLSRLGKPVVASRRVMVLLIGDV